MAPLQHFRQNGDHSIHDAKEIGSQNVFKLGNLKIIEIYNVADARCDNQYVYWSEYASNLFDSRLILISIAHVSHGRKTGDVGFL